MANIAVNRVTNANVYINGNNKIGRAEEVNMPDLKVKQSDHKALGMVGTVELPSGVDKLEMKIKWNSIYADIEAINNPFAAQQIMIRANLETYASAGRTNEVPVVIFATVLPKNIKLGDFKQHDNVEKETNYTVTAVKQIIDGVTVLEYDSLANIFKVNGVDVLATYKANTGA